MEHIRVNLPSTYKSYINGNGEGVWVLVENNAKKAYDTDENNTSYECILDNDSCYYPSLKHGTKMPIEMRGDKRPVVPYSWLVKNFPNKEV